MRASPWFMVAVLTAVNAVNWADRHVMSILFPGIRADLELTDTQLGMVGGLAFSAIYAISSFGFGYLADRRIRRNIVAFGLLFWSVATAAGAYATDFLTLFGARFFTGIGEASLYPAAMSLIAERLSVGRRGRAMGIFGAASAVGGGAGIALGGVLSSAYGWRTVLMAYGAVGLLLIPALLSVPEKPRAVPTGRDADTPAVMRRLITDVRLLAIWTSGLVMIASGLGYATWVPSYFVRVRGMELSEAGTLFGLAMLVGGMGGSLLGGYFADRRRRARFAGELDVPIVAALSAAPLAAATLVAETPLVFIVCGLLAPLAIFAYFPSLQTVIVELVPPRQHGIAYAINILFLGGIGSALGPYVVGAVSDATGGLQTAMAVPIVGMVVASAMMVGAAALVRRGRPAAVAATTAEAAGSAQSVPHE